MSFGAMLLTTYLAGAIRNEVFYQEVFETSQNEVLRRFHHMQYLGDSKFGSMVKIQYRGLGTHPQRVNFEKLIDWSSESSLS